MLMCWLSYPKVRQFFFEVKIIQLNEYQKCLAMYYLSFHKFLFKER